MKSNAGTAPRIIPSRRQLSWFLCLRVLVITLFLGGAIFYQVQSTGYRPGSVLSYHYGLVGLSYLHALLSALALPRLKSVRCFIQSQLVWDLVVVAAFIYLTGGIDSPFSFLFIFVILCSGVFCRRKEILFTASAAAILYGSLVELQFFGYLPHPPWASFRPFVNEGEVFYAVFINVSGFFLTALLSGALAERFQKSEQALEKAEIDYVELEKLNQTLIANITSGLMIINEQGRIRSFNAAAAKITGYSLPEVYNRPTADIFPQIHVLDSNGFIVVGRGEGFFLDKERQLRPLGYSSSLVKDPQEKTLGLLVSFQDLTHLKEMEEALKQADRLAAVGRLAAGMAHEIRNPLASISGSVQLLMEGSNVSRDDLRLMRIVVKEADRLSRLLTDFLEYARPVPPKFEITDVSALLDELADMASSDPRFEKVKIVRDYPPGEKIRLDRQQIFQAVWNLVINAAEVLESGGTLRLGVLSRRGEIFVQDSGQGIPENIRDKIFEPFFTTKNNGTGLGLATTHAIVEAHGGKIEVSSVPGGGTRLTIKLQAR
ncbi:PAS domain-containing sensor histidine kinase [Desulfuromonas versatilis]|uniref:histidine kinase n=1 Tax=Desulfuromonas versatilis TaxID=2802975 RepID=A0ABN6DXB7_9BACT|nr:ATP-binding protein [Desulfuromonas versatilis]BCR04662.1 PAS domain-containing sensor histidine kinase [Desulfuromonas versatilis]